MRASSLPSPSGPGRLGRNLGYFLVAPLTATVVLSLILAFTVVTYQSQHNGRIYTGVSVWGADLSQMNPAEANDTLLEVYPYAQEEGIVFIDPGAGQRWEKMPSDLGLSFDISATVDAALGIGRVGNPLAQLQGIFESWYYGHSVAPVLIFDEAKLGDGLSELATEINRSSTNAALKLDGESVEYAPGLVGRNLDVSDLRRRLIAPLTDFRQAEFELLIHDIQPAVRDDAVAMAEIQRLITGGPVTFFLQEPLHELDLDRVTLSQEEMLQWLRVEYVTESEGATRHQVFLDENGVRHWLSQFADQIYREPVNARFYFNDDTRELVLVAPHVTGRALDVEATLARFMEQVATPNRSVPFVLEEILPVVHSGATATELGVTELITQATTWFYGSSDARKHNIARAAANFYGIVVAPGEEFSFNRYLGTVTEDDGYEEGLIIVGGRTIKGIGGGVCQVSTTMFQTAFWAGFPITERWEHGYMLEYYDDGEGPGMDATVFSPIVDLRFINNTPHHLLIENYYNEANEALTFKFYSTSLGRRVVKGDPNFENIVPAPEEDVWEFDEDVESGWWIQIDQAVEGADVTVQRTVFNANGEELINEFFVSNYIPYPNVYHYGLGVEVPNNSSAP
jgi:vancomycin resistance protein YoaR